MKSRQTTKLCTLAGALLLTLGPAAWSQQPVVPDGGTGTAQPSVPPAIDSTPWQPPDLPPQIAQRQAKMLNDSRQKQMVLDTQRLVALANELKIDVDKSNKDTLSLDVIRKADEIEKLAHSVKERMKGSE